MDAIGTVGKILISPVAALAGAFDKPKVRPELPAPARPVTRNMAAEAARRDDQFRRRRGAGANELTGGAEARTPGGKTLLGQ